MEQHQIPQDVTGYKFNLFGILNLKQFLELIIPVGISWLIISVVPLPFISWPIGIILSLYGLLAAFVPIQERPLNYWIITFLKIMYAPTKFYWRKVSRIPDILRYAAPTLSPTNDLNLPTQRYQPISYSDYSDSLSDLAPDPLDHPRTAYINNLLDSFAEIPVTEVAATPQFIRPALSDDMTLRQREIQPL